jgi:predicted TIM-barrel fold metal-dependent hydrolase
MKETTVTNAPAPTCISADSHVVEPPEVYDGLDKRFGSRAPRMVQDPDRGLVTDHGDGTFGYPVGVFHVVGRDWGDPATREDAKRGFELARPGVLDVNERTKDQELDGLNAEILYPSVLFSIYQLQDVEIQAATMANYNDWVFNYSSQAPGRLFSLALTQLRDVDVAIAEMTRMKNQGAVGMCIPCTAPPDLPYSDPHYDRFWAAAQDLKMPLTMHIFTSATRNHDLPDWGVHNYTLASTGIARTILDLIWGGVCERFPEITFIPTEFETGWIAYFLQRGEATFHREGGLKRQTHMSMTPIEYWRRNFLATFEDDEVGIRTRDIIGVDNLLWGSDYPHHDSIFPESQSVLDRIFEGVPDEDRYKITVANACRVYDLPFDW